MISCRGSVKRVSNSNNFYKERKMDIIPQSNTNRLSKSEAIDLLVQVRRVLSVTTADMIDKISDDRETDIDRMVLLISKITHNL